MLITHKHSDHYDVDAIKTILNNNPKAKIFTNKSMAAVLLGADMKSEILESGEVTIGDFAVKAFFAEHEPLPNPVSPNTAFLINNQFLHPGDSFAEPILSVRAEVIALPVAAPWLTVVKALDFVLRYKPEQVIPAHDGFVKNFSLERQYENWRGWLSPQKIKFHPFAEPGQFIEI